jgi:hypothetical protein
MPRCRARVTANCAAHVLSRSIIPERRVATLVADHENPNTCIDRAVDDGVRKAAEWIDAAFVFGWSSDIRELSENLHDALKLRQKPSGDAASGLRFVETERVGQVPLGAAM